MIKNVVLDLDNTLISAEPIEEFPFESPGIRDKCIKFPIYDMDGYYIIFERPHLQQFLDYLFSNFRVSVWTAATKDYALFIIKHIILTKPERTLDHILFSYHCDISEQKFDYSKKLDCLYNVFKIDGYNSTNTIIIDDLQEVFTCQPKNAIHIKAFKILDDGSEQDNELKTNVPTQIKQKFKNLLHSV